MAKPTKHVSRARKSRKRVSTINQVIRASAARRQAGLEGFRRVRGKTNTYERTVEYKDRAQRKRIIERLPPDSRVTMLVQGEDPKKLLRPPTHARRVAHDEFCGPR